METEENAEGLETTEEETTETEETTVVEEPWMKTEEAGEQTPDDPSKTVPVGKFVSVKKALRGKLSDSQDEVERLTKENEALRGTTTKAAPAPVKRPTRVGYASDGDYDDAMDNYYDSRTTETVRRASQQEEEVRKHNQAQEATTEAVDSHYDRAATLIESSGIKPEIFKQADTSVRAAVDSILPKSGDIVVDQLISVLGEGSEKVLYFLGRNPAALNKFQSLLASDKSGMKAAIYLGQEKQRLTNPRKGKTQAPAPAAQAHGDVQTSVQGTAFKKRYDSAHKTNNTQAAYNAKKEARAAGVDVAAW